MSRRTVNFDIPEDSLKTIDEIAGNLGVDRQAVLSEALTQYLADYEELKSEVEEAERQIDAGNFLTQEEMEARFEAKFLKTTKAA